MAESSIFWDQLIQLVEEGKVVPVVGQDLLTIPESTGHKLLYPFLAERLAKYIRVSADGLPEGAELNEVAGRYLSKGKPAQHIYAALKTVAAEANALPGSRASDSNSQASGPCPFSSPPRLTLA